MAAMREHFLLSRQRSPVTPACWTPGTRPPATAAGRESPAARNTAGGWSLWTSAPRGIDLTGNMLTGVIPSNISRCTSLRLMRISSNKQLQGSIPDEIGNMPSLAALGLYDNSITGTIPRSFGNLSQLTKLSLKNNNLEGSIPARIGNNPYLRFLQLSHNNLSGLLPPSLYNLSSLNMLSVGNNKLHGRPPPDLRKSLPSIQQFGIGRNRFSGPFPLSLTNLSSLQLLDIGFNSFTGVVPSQIGRLRNLNVLFLSTNMFEANNKEEWEFVSSLTNCSRLQVLAIERNRFAGELPSSVANLTTNLQLLRIHTNHISGFISSEIGNLASLEEIDFTSNLLTGVIPQSIGKLTQLNQGPIPPSIGNLTKISGLALSRNNLAGFIPNEIMELSSLSIILDLSHNLLEGPLPLGVSNLVNVKELWLSGNKLSEYGEGLGVSTYGDVFSLGITLIELFTGKSPTNDMFKDGISLHHYAEVAFPGQCYSDSRCNHMAA
ncbi:hypothetical protein C2845_PM03G24680 [Panicum miliaceum]|uniref:LRR receptor-like serine/threonine-protein kinase n=1 Tax=Panicum miliaceum TaxID=4540 RepID=A0A3L6TD56_PANMI|nr:hypothetical protein C2845_PM03G24680 [Panicum miliaceum]